MQSSPLSMLPHIKTARCACFCVSVAPGGHASIAPHPLLRPPVPVYLRILNALQFWILDNVLMSERVIPDMRPGSFGK